MPTLDAVCHPFVVRPSDRRPFPRRSRWERPAAPRQAGFQLVELLVTLAFFAVVVAMSVPPVLGWWRALAVEIAAQEVAGALQAARLYSIRNNSNTAIRFDTVGDFVHHTLYRDGDGDGVRNDDIVRGHDPQVGDRQRIGAFGGVQFGFPPGSAPRSPSGGRLDRLDDPIRFNRSDLASFSKDGTATPGTVYLTDGQSRLMAVRVTSRSGRIRVLSYDPKHQRWME